jgi:hypothetical protein
MKKRTRFQLILPLLMFPLFSFGQYNFVVQNGSASVYNTIDEAYQNAVSGDTIYVPGGSFNMPATIDKSLVWIGVGYHPDSTESTFYSRINNAVSFKGTCDGTFITGIHFISSVSFGSSGDDALDVILFRNRIDGSLTLKYNDGGENLINTRLSECILNGNITANMGKNVFMEKSVIYGTLSYFRSSTFDRNIFTHGGRNSGSGYSYLFTYTENCLIRNSVINYYSYTNWRAEVYENTNNTFNNNIFAGSIIFPDFTNVGNNNLINVDLSTVFEHIEGTIDIYSYLHNFHLKSGSPAIGAGSLGTDIGIYGGTNSYKDGGLPFTPHIRSVNIDEETSNGLLGVEIEAVSQDK